METKKVKNLIIGGVHKAGTTSLFTYLSWHPEICGSDIKETHFFSDESYPKRYNSYDAFFRKYKGQKYRLEASPEYIYGKEEVADKIAKVLPDSKLIFILRNPAEKILSSFNHRKKVLLFEPNYTFQDFQKEHLNIQSLNEIEHSNESSRELMDGSYIDYLPSWFEKFDSKNIKVLFFDDFKENPALEVGKICAWLAIDKSIYDGKIFDVENKSVSIRNGSLQKMAISTGKRIEPILRRNYQLKKFLRKIYYSVNVGRENKSMLVNLNDIEQLYKAKNKALKDFLWEKGYRDFPAWL